MSLNYNSVGTSSVTKTTAQTASPMNKAAKFQSNPSPKKSAFKQKSAMSPTKAF